MLNRALLGDHDSQMFPSQFTDLAIDNKGWRKLGHSQPIMMKMSDNRKVEP